MKLRELCEATEISVPSGFADLEITLPVIDSRAAVAGSLFICIDGLHTDGHDYIKGAIDRGAVCVLAMEGRETVLPAGICLLTAPDTRRASAVIFNAFYGDPVSKMKFIGVTGTNGKTSVTHMLRSILEASLCRCGIVGTVGCRSAGGRSLHSGGSDPTANMTTPDPPELYRILSEMQSDGVEYVIMEVTSHALALGKTEPISFAAGIFTNLTPEHLDFHGSMKAYAEAKAELFRNCRLSVLNLDDPAAREMAAAAGGRTVTCGIADGRADYTAQGIVSLGKNGVRYELKSGRSRLQLQCPIPGDFTVMNSMQAAVCALELGIPAGAVKVALASMAGVPGRLERLRLGMEADFGVILDYAHTPDALEKLLRTAKSTCGSGERLVLLFGCGGDRDKSKRPVMGHIAQKYADHVILTSDNSRSEDPAEIIRQILIGMDAERVTVIQSRREAIRQAILQAEPGDLILLAGKGHEEYEITREGRQPFSEREIVRAAMAERAQRGEPPATDGKV